MFASCLQLNTTSHSFNKAQVNSTSSITPHCKDVPLLDLSGADLSWTYLEKADLSSANLTFANLFRAVFYDRLRSFPPPRSSFCLRQPEANPSKGRRLPDGYTEANDWRLTYSANLSGADLSYANLSRTKPTPRCNAQMVGDKRRGRVILQVQMRGINPRNPPDHHRLLNVHSAWALV